MDEWTDENGKKLSDYPQPSLAVDTAVLTVVDDALCVALVDRAGSHRLPGTFLHEGETLAQAVARSLRQRAGLSDVKPRQLRTFDAVDRDDRGRVVTVAHLIALPAERLSDVELIPVYQATGLDFDHDEIVVEAVNALRLAYSEHPDPQGLLGAEFTVLELHRLHGVVDPATAQKDTFRRAMMPHLVSTGRMEIGSVGKPAKLYARK